MDKHIDDGDFYEVEYLLVKHEKVVGDTIHTNYETALTEAGSLGAKVVPRRWWERNYPAVDLSRLREYTHRDGARISKAKRRAIVADYLNHEGNQYEIAERHGVNQSMVSYLVREYRGQHRR